MLHLRPYKSCDSLKIAEWIKEKDIFLKWGGDRFGEFPISAEIIDDKYRLKTATVRIPTTFFRGLLLTKKTVSWGSSA